jgi:hypothetical protein
MDEVVFNDEEFECISNKQFLLVKARALKKTETYFWEISSELETINEELKIPEIQHFTQTRPKVSKGENYKGLPYIILDYPRHFKTNEVFAYRNMFYWGNFFSCTIHLQGQNIKEIRKRLLEKYHELSQNDFYLAIHETPWEYTYSPDNYKKIYELGETEYRNILNTHPFIKISRSIPLEEYRQFQKFSSETYRFLINIMFWSEFEDKW